MNNKQEIIKDFMCNYDGACYMAVKGQYVALAMLLEEEYQITITTKDIKMAVNDLLKNDLLFKDLFERLQA
jgi:hypothetical protein